MKMRPTLTAVTGAALGLALLAPVPAGAQATLGLGVGPSVPVYEASLDHRPGGGILAFRESPFSTRLALRTELGLVLLPPSESQSGYWGSGNLSIAGVHGTVVYTPLGVGSGPYAFLGFGVHVLRKPGEVRAFIPGMNLGLGTFVHVRGVDLFAQARAEAPFTPFGTPTEFGPTMYLPLTLGVRLPLGND